jgi:hypothetical protein
MNTIETRKRVIQQIMEMVRGGGVRAAAAAWPMSPSDMRTANPGTLLKRLVAMSEHDLSVLAKRVEDAYEEWAYAAAVLVGEARARKRLIAARAIVERIGVAASSGTGPLVGAIDTLERIVADARSAAVRGENVDLPAILSEMARQHGAIGSRVDRSGRVRAAAGALATSLQTLAVVETA